MVCVCVCMCECQQNTVIFQATLSMMSGPITCTISYGRRWWWRCQFYCFSVWHDWTYAVTLVILFGPRARNGVSLVVPPCGPKLVVYAHTRITNHQKALPYTRGCVHYIYRYITICGGYMCAKALLYPFSVMPRLFSFLFHTATHKHTRTHRHTLVSTNEKLFFF